MLPLYLQAVRGDDALGTGVKLLPMMAGLIVGARASEPLGARLGLRPVVAGGLGVLAAGLALGAATRADTGYAFIAGWLTITGLGVGLAIAPAMDAVLGELPPERSGSGAALTMAMRQVGGALGVALLGSLASAVYTGQLGRTAGLGEAAVAADARSAFVSAMSVVLLACAAVTAVGAVGVLTGLRGLTESSRWTASVS
jgi:MFS family permease